MAANDYYNPFNSQQDNHPKPHSSLNAPASHPPYPDTDSSTPSRRPSPYVDHSYNNYYDVDQRTYQASGLDTSYNGPYGQRRTGSDPFNDSHAIPLQSQQSLMEQEPSNAAKYNQQGFLQQHPTDADAAAAEMDRPSDRPKKRGLRGFFAPPFPWAVAVLTLIHIIVFIAEIAKNASLTKSPIGIKPFNPMIGPSTFVLINMGARYDPCMRNTPGIQDSQVEILWPCPNATASVAECSLSELCGFGGVPNPRPGGSQDDKPEPNQWWRLIVPIFLHAGLIHIAFNLLVQVTLGRQMEKSIGTLRFLLVYFPSGIFGFVLGANYAAAGIASTGASGSLFGIFALILLELLYTWKERQSPVKDLLWLLLEIVIALALGLLPGLDNFSHIGGFLMGLVLGICILHSPNGLRTRIHEDSAPYVSVGGASVNAGRGQRPSSVMVFLKKPLAFFQGRKPLWWAWWILRAGALVAVLIGFIVLLNNFYVYRKTCSWCKYLSCIDINNWCDIGNLRFRNQTTIQQRDLFGLNAPTFLPAVY